MSENRSKKLSRRDALKVLGAAAGATALANLPKKWDSPELLSGVLPAHAQTSVVCTQYAVSIEITSGFFEESAWFPEPDESGWNGLPGSYARWLCQSGCLFFSAFTTDSGIVQVTTVSTQFTLNFPDYFTHNVLINMETGEYALNFETPPAGCQWPPQ